MTDLRADYSDATEPGGGRDVAKFYSIDAYEHATKINQHDAQLAGFTLPPTSGWSGYNLGSNTATADRGHQLLTVASDATLNLRGRVRTLSPTSNYTAEFRLDAVYPPATTTSIYWFFGIILVDSATGKTILFGVGDLSNASATVNMVVAQWPAVTGAGASTVTSSAFPAPHPQWWRIRDDATTRYYEYSFNRFDWQPAYSEARTTYITPNQIGYAVINTATSLTGVLRVRSMSGIT
jgi:hypothetical protein